MRFLHLVFVSFAAATHASPLYGRNGYAEPYFGRFGLSPVVRARPAFDGPSFAPVRNEEQISANDIDADDSYSFEYGVQAEDGSHSRQEARDSEGTVTGRYTITLSDGRMRVVDYIADKDGFRARVDTNEPGTDNQAPADVEWTSSAPGASPSRPSSQKPKPNTPNGINPRPTETFVVPPNVISEPGAQDGSITSRPTVVPTGPSRPIQVIQPGVPATADEPRTPHHPPIGFLPPEPFSRIHLAPPRPINTAWGPAIAQYDPLFSSQWPVAHAPFILTSYPIKKKK
ncbi:uncharacterized protein LOC100899177 [Galendromus occidentalis]|uniref:Uncharacterized protein LOC100899177 n=1 Tax=Galendromus occidentalis TaxID=34638 RepID=A0AAJ6QRZ0_9ACAR|nr:uncharacterized protein LOC100899177 [Galendromus occidentalis]